MSCDRGAFTDYEILKAMLICGDGSDSCEGCPLQEIGVEKCTMELIRRAREIIEGRMDVIVELQEENKKLREEIAELKNRMAEEKRL